MNPNKDETGPSMSVSLEIKNKQECWKLFSVCVFFLLVVVLAKGVNVFRKMQSLSYYY